jgi:hypothetical protein
MGLPVGVEVEAGHVRAGSVASHLSGGEPGCGNGGSIPARRLYVPVQVRDRAAVVNSDKGVHVRRTRGGAGGKSVPHCAKAVFADEAANAA